MYDRYHGLIFDMDGTILDTEPSHVKAWQQALSKYDMAYDYEIMKHYNGTPTAKVAQLLIDKYKKDIDPQILVAEKVSLLENFIFDEVKALPLIDIVKYYYGKKPMAVGTGSLHQLADRLLDRLGIHHYFDAIVGADDVNNHKPAPDTFLLCAKLIDVEPGKCVVFEDADFGIQAAKAANMDFVDVRKL